MKIGYLRITEGQYHFVIPEEEIEECDKLLAIIRDTERFTVTWNGYIERFIHTYKEYRVSSDVTQHKILMG